MNFQNPDISLLKNKKLFIFDMDGTIYLGKTVFPFAIRFIKHLREHGKQVMFFTNNASHSSAFYYQKLKNLGFEPTPQEIMTAGDVTAEFLLRHRNGKAVYLIGTQELEDDFRQKGIALVNETDASADIVVSSFDTSLVYEKLNIACNLIIKGAEYLSTHPDFNCPTDTGIMPDSGAIAALITASTGKVPTYFGKPCRETLDMICEATGLKKEDLCIFGDRLYTDIAIGRKNGMTAVLVLSGETTMEDVEAADAADRPDYIFPSLDEVDKIFFE